MKPTRVLLFFAVMLVLIFPVFSISAAGDVHMYLPVVLRQDAPPVGGKPVLKTPANGAGLDTLIPTFSWSMGPQENDTQGCMTYSKSPGPESCMMIFSASRDDWQQVMWDNLDPGQVYYWRVGIYKEFGKILAWSDEWHFTTGQAGGLILPPPALVYPANSSTIPSAAAVFTWQAVDGAVEYRVSLHNITSSRYYGFVSPGPQVNIRADLLPAGENFEWSVKARNAYAWGAFSPTWIFSTAAASGVIQSRVDPPILYKLLDHDLNWVFFTP